MDQTPGIEGRFSELTKKVIGAAIEAHRELGPGLLESTYEQALAYELRLAALEFKIQAALPVTYKGITLDCGYRADFLVEELLILELKSVDNITAIHEAQLLTYMKVADCPVGLLLNFNVKLMKNGIRRFVI